MNAPKALIVRSYVSVSYFSALQLAPIKQMLTRIQSATIRPVAFGGTFERVSRMSAFGAGCKDMPKTSRYVGF
jgi:hypothetical protein